MNIFLILAFLFFIGSCVGWIIEVFYRHFHSGTGSNRRWINPGFCTGPYLPLYGCGLCTLYLVARLEDSGSGEATIWSKLAFLLIMAVAMTVIEYIAGVISVSLFKVRLWDYSQEWANIQGIICPKFSMYWALLGAIYYFLVHPYILDALVWLSNNLAFSFVIGLFFGIFSVDVVASAQLIARLKRFADENEVIVRYEAIKAEIRRRYDENKQKYHFFHPFHTEQPLVEHLKELKESFEQQKSKLHKGGKR